MLIDLRTPDGAHKSGKHYINLLWGRPAPSLLPISELADASRAVFADETTAIECLEYNENRGHFALRRELSQWLGRFYSATTTPEQLCITGGASQSLATILQIVTDPLVTEAVWMIEPCYFQACRVFEESGLTGKLRPVQEDEQGNIDLEYLERKLVESETSNTKTLDPKTKPVDPSRRLYRHVIYVVPTFSNPAGAVMPLENRQRLVALARAHDALIISDDVYDVLQWSTGEAPLSGSTLSPSFSQSQLPRLIDIERQLPNLPSDPQDFGHVPSNATFSKLIAPGLRCGWVDGSEKITSALSNAGSTRSGGCPSGIVAPMVANLLQNGSFERHIRDALIPAYARRRSKIVDAIRTYLTPLGFKLGPEDIAASEQAHAQPNVVGGFFLWVRLPPGLKSRKVVKKAVEEENLDLLPGAACAIVGQPAANIDNLDSHIRLCFSLAEEQDLSEGMLRLRDVAQRLQQELTGP